MSTLPVLADTYLCAMRAHQGESAVANVFCVRSSVTQSSSDVATHVQGAWFLSNSIADQQSEDMKYDALEVLPLDGTSLSIIVDLTGQIGGISQGADCVQAAVVTTFRTAERGRSRRGRMYLGGIPTDHTQDFGTRWDTGVVTDMSTAWFSFRDDLDSHNLTHEILSRKLGDSLPVLSHRVNSYLGTIRRRSEREERP